MILTEQTDTKSVNKTNSKITARLLKFHRTEKRLWIEITGNSIGGIVTSNESGSTNLVEHFYNEFNRNSADNFPAYMDSIKMELQQFISDRRLKGIKTICILPKESVSVIPMSFPNLPASKLKKTVYMSLIGKLGEEERKICYDFIYKPDKKTANKQVKVISVTAKEDYIQALIDAVESAGCTVEDVTFPSTEYGEIFKANEEHNDEDGILVIDIGRDSASFVFFENSNPVYWREEQKLGMHTMLSAVDSTISLGSDVLHLTKQEAEQLISRYGIAEESSEEEITGKRMPLFQLYSMLRPYVERLVSTTRIALSRFKKEYEGLNIKSIYITGCGSYMKGLPEYISRVLNIPTMLLPVWEHISGTKKAIENEPNLKYCLSNSAVIAERTSKGINLMPRKEFLNRIVNIGARAASFVLFTVLALLVFFQFSIGRQTERYRKILSRITPSSDAQTQVTKESAVLMEIRGRIDWYQKAISTIPSTHRWMGILGDLARLVPDHITLERIVFSRKSGISILELSGNAYLASGEATGSAFELAKSLKSSSFIKEVINVGEESVENKLLQSKMTRFEIKCELRDLPAIAEVKPAVKTTVNKGF